MGFWTLANLFCIFIATSFVYSENAGPFKGDRVVRVVPKNEGELNVLRSLVDNPRHEIDFWKHPSHVGVPVDMHVSSEAYKNLAIFLKDNNIRFTIQIIDVQVLVDMENEDNGRARAAPSWYGRYHTLEEIEKELNNTVNQYPNMVKKILLGTSYEKRPQHALEIKGKPSEDKPIFFINCAIHAREWVSPATCMYFIKQMVSKYGKDAAVTVMLDKMDFVIMPVFNVDGYAFTWVNNDRARVWRKTRKPHPDYWWCVGVDPNRNWDYKWGGVGASTSPCSDSYRGPHAFSEQEVKNVADYLKSRGSRIKAYMDIHAYSQMWMIPWGYTKDPSPDHQELMRVSNAAAAALKKEYNTEYKVGPSSVIIYDNSGSSKDYTYGALGIKYSFALELRDQGRYGFFLPANQIIPTALETFEGLKAAVREMDV